MKSITLTQDLTAGVGQDPAPAEPKHYHLTKTLEQDPKFLPRAGVIVAKLTVAVHGGQK